MRAVKVCIGLFLVMGLMLGSLVTSTRAQEAPTASPNYQISEPQFGVNTENETCSGAYCARATIGSLDAGADEPPRSTDFGAIPQDSEPLLEVIVDPGESHLGVLSTSETAKKTTIVRVRAYLTDGYTLHIFGEPPKYNGHNLSSLTSPTASAPGTEQFGINAVRNNSLSFGADPVQIPSDLMSFGQVATGYSTPDLYKYTDGEMIASSSVESGRTDYTVSMIVNISNATPAGHFVGDYSAVVVPRF